MLDRWLNADRKAAARQFDRLMSLMLAPGQDAEDAHPPQDAELLAAAAAPESAEDAENARTHKAVNEWAVAVLFQNARKYLRRQIANAFLISFNTPDSVDGEGFYERPGGIDH